MCLIAFSPTGAPMPREVFNTAHADNPDGIGIMSSVAVEKFLGRKAPRKAWRLMMRLAADGIPYAVHFRWRTHGPINRALTHPFTAPDGATYVMHNGVIGETAAYSGADESDTSVFVRDFVDFSRVPEDERAEELAALAEFIGRGNKLCILDMPTGRFSLCNEESGDWVDGLWYSNVHSLPDHMLPDWARRKWMYTAPAAVPPSRYLETDTAYPLPDARELPHADNESSYYRALSSAAGYYDLGHGIESADDADDYRDTLRALAACGMSH